MRNRKGELDNIISMLLEGDLTNTKKNINALQNATTKHDPRKHTDFIRDLIK